MIVILRAVHRLNAPLIAQGEDELFGVIRDNNTLPPAMRELFVSRSKFFPLKDLILDIYFLCQILRIAVLNNASYEW